MTARSGVKPVNRRAAAACPIFVPGDSVADRYRIDRYVARGGVGEVYEAFDLELQTRVALKTLRPALLADRRAIERLRREAATARAVTHPNVCRIYDVGRHERADGETIHFVTMEYLEGETLAERLDREGVLGQRSALRIALQVAAGLSAAHASGVVHRDIKGSNILLVGDGARQRAVVTDFGLALDTGSSELEEHEPVAGTPLFMAPEQIEGAEITPATDVYAFGVLLYQMVTGKWPFVGKTAMATALLRTQTEPPPPSEHVQGMRPGLEKLILQCLARDARRRYQDARELEAALRRLRTSPSLLRRWGWLAASILVLVALSWWLARPRAEPAAARAGVEAPAADGELVGNRRSIAVVGFDNLSADPTYDWIATAVREALAAHLVAGGEMRVISRSETFELQADAQLSRYASLDASELDRLRQRSDVDLALVGEFDIRRQSSPELDPASGQTVLASQLELELRVKVFDLAADGAQPFDRSEKGTLDDLSALVGSTAQSVRGRFWSAVDRSEVERASTVLPSSPAAARLFAEGLDHQRLLDPRAAIAHFEEALVLAPHHPLIHTALAQAWAELGFDRQAREQALAAFEARETLPRELELLIEARHHTAENRWRRSEELYRALWEFYPGNLDYGLGLAQAQERQGRLDDALATMEQLRQAGPEKAELVRLELAESLLAMHRGDLARSTQRAESAAARARSIGARSLLAASLERLAGTLLEDASRAEEARSALSQAVEIYAQVGQSRGQANATLKLGDLARRVGDREAALGHYRRALELSEQTGNRRSQATALTSLAIVRDQRGELRRGLQLKQEALVNYRERDIRQGVAITLENLAISSFKLGRLDASLEHFEQVRGLLEELQDGTGLQYWPYHVGRLWLEFGDLELAEASQLQALRSGEESGNQILVGYVHYEFARLSLLRAQLAPAQEHASKALEIFEEQQSPSDIADMRLVQAEIAIARGDPERARAEAALARTHYLTLGAAQGVLESDALLLQAQLAAESLLASSSERFESTSRSRKERQRMLREMEQRAAAMQYLSVALRAQITAALARVRWRLGSSESVHGALSAVVAQADGAGLQIRGAEARLVLAELLLAAEEALPGRPRQILEDLLARRDAGDLPLLRRRAEALLEQAPSALVALPQ